jgi:hypothetical protein
MSVEPPVLVETVKPEKESQDWAKGALLERKWGVRGRILGRSDSHGLIYHVKHDDGTFAWYEPRELKFHDDKAEKADV